MASAAVLAGLIVMILNYSFPAFKEIAPTVHTKSADSQPARIKIPSIYVDAVIEPTALTSDGLMDVPKLPADTAWYKLGPAPGKIGSAIIDGHVNWKHGAKAVFSDLHKLKAGDKVLVTDDLGATVSFVVRLSRTYGSNAEASDIFTSSDGKAHLNLITCQGVWDKAAQGYTQRLVVFTDKE